MSDIVLSNGIRSNLLSLQNSASLLDKTQNRLATGKKVNSALDDPLNYFQSQTLNSRANDLSRLLDGINLGVKTLETADNAITQMVRLVETAQAGARTALQSTSTNAKLGSGMDPLTRTAVDYVANPNLVGVGGKFQVGDTFTVSGTDNLGVAFSFTVAMGAATYTATNFTAAINASAPGLAGTVNASIDVSGRLIVDNVKGGTLRDVVDHLMFEGLLVEDPNDGKPLVRIGDPEAVRAVYRGEIAIEVRRTPPGSDTGRSASPRNRTRNDRNAAVEALEGRGIEHGEVIELTDFGIAILSFSDPDGVHLELTSPLA